ncbi:hypothetical protein QBE55_12345 [Eubacteriales bacterium mix99]
MRSAVRVIIGLAGQTPITIYDEAYLGMDAAMRKLFISELLSDYTQRPKLILFSTHFVNEMEGLFSDEYSGSGDTTCPVLGNRHSGITETTIPVVETVYKYPL